MSIPGVSKCPGRHRERFWRRPSRCDRPCVPILWTTWSGFGRGTIPGGLFCSNNGGRPWSLVETLWNLSDRKEWQGEDYDAPGIHSICLDPRDPSIICRSQYLLVPGHHNGVFVSRNGDKRWTELIDAAPSALGLAHAVHPQDPETACRQPDA